MDFYFILHGFRVYDMRTCGQAQRCINDNNNKTNTAYTMVIIIYIIDMRKLQYHYTYADTMFTYRNAFTRMIITIIQVYRFFLILFARSPRAYISLMLIYFSIVVSYENIKKKQKKKFKIIVHIISSRRHISAYNMYICYTYI